MLRKLLCVALVVGVGCFATLVEAQEKDKAKEKAKEEKPAAQQIKAKLKAVDLKKSTITVEMAGKTSDVEVGKDVKFFGPRGGKADKGLKDDRMTAGATLGLVMDGKMLKEIHLPVRTTATKEKEKGKEKAK